MTALERTALTAAFLAATVAVGLALSTVPGELVTLVVFSSGILLGAGRGGWIGAAGMTLYVFANSAVKGFPPSPLPLLAAQALGMAFPGVAGGWWRRLWLRGGIPRRSALITLPVWGVVLTAVYQAITNLAFAFFLADESAPRWAAFLSGMSFGLVDMALNGLVFALAGPRVASGLRRIARDRGWWGRPVGLSLLLLGWGTSVCGAQSPGPGTAPDAGDSASVSPTPVTLRPIPMAPEPLWIPMDVRVPIERGAPTVVLSDSLAGRDISRVASPGLSPSLDAWGLGWGRTKWSVDGLPLGGPVHGFDEPPDIPLAWRGAWSERWSAAGTSFELTPTPVEGPPVSQISITTGGYDRRTTEFGLARRLGGVQLGVDFLDRIEQGRQNLLAAGLADLEELDHSRLWLRLAQAPGRRPNWSIDVSTGNEERRLADGSTLERGARRILASLRGPFLGGETRLGGQLRRHSLRLEGGPAPFGEVRFDGFTLQGDWALPGIRGLSARARWDRDRRRGVVEPRITQDGFAGTLAWATAGEIWSAGAEGTVGNQEPYGFTWSGIVNGGRRFGPFWLRLSAAHEEDLPGLVVGLDRPSPEEGMEDHLLAYETVAEPEERTAVRAEVDWKLDRARLVLGGWAGRIENYRLDSNPLWSVISSYSPIPYPDPTADVVGGYGRLDLPLPWNFRGEGRGRVQSRESQDVPYLPRWTLDGALHWRRLLFRESLDVDLALGGMALGPRRTPEGESYPAAGTGYLRLHGRIDQGVLTMAMENLLDAYVESDLRASDYLTALPTPGRTFYIGLTFYLFQ